MKTTVYLNEAAEERFKKIKAVNPNYSLSEATDAGLRLEETKVDTQLSGMEEQIAVKGNSNQGAFYGTKAKFVGRKLARVQIGPVGVDAYDYQTLYFTKKGKYLIQFTTENDIIGDYEYTYVICNTIEELQQEASAKLLTEAGTTAGEFLEDLDI
jgi:hypothetical protein